MRIVTLGCKVNQCDGEEIARALAARGYALDGSDAEADVYIVNTCTVTSTADAKGRKLVRRLARTHPQAIVIVTGCGAQVDPTAAAALPGVHAVVPNSRKCEIADVLGRFRSPAANARRPAPRPRTRAFLKIQDGCDHRCAYCLVPDARGRPRSKPMAEVTEEMLALAADGVQEAVLCGIRLGAYGRDTGEGTLAGLLQELRGTPIPRLRLSSIEPMDLDDDLVSGIAANPSVCPHFHLPLQSGDDSVLAAMGRGYSTGDYAGLAGGIRSTLPDAVITTDVMVGFPGETEERFRRTLDFARKTAFSRVHVFPYSPRPGTPAAARAGRIPDHVRRQRTQRMLALAEELARSAAQAWIGRAAPVLFEQRDGSGMLTGLTPQYMRVHSPGPDEWIGAIVEVCPAREAGGELVCGA